MKQILTSDNSITFHSEEFDETYHSTSGAKEEAIKKFVEPCKISDYQDALTILDVCFGIGYNTAAAIDAFKGKKITILALENDLNIVKQVNNINPEFKCWSIIKEVATNLEYKGTYNNKEITIKLIMGDARQTIKEIKEKFDCIFLDPFSPKKCPELWTEDFFKEIKDRLKPDATLATYSCARSVRTNLEAVGLKTEDGPCVGRKSPSTIARN